MNGGNASQRSEIPLFILTALAVIGVVVLTALHDPVPDLLNNVALAALVGGGAVTIPKVGGGGNPPPPAA